MKKILTIFFVVLSFIAAGAQNKTLLSEYSLSDFVNLMNGECPVDYGDGIELQKVFINNDNVIFQMKFGETELVEAINEMPELSDTMANLFLSEWAMDENILFLMKLLIHENKNLVMRFTAPGTSKVGDITINSSKLSETIKKIDINRAH